MGAVGAVGVGAVGGWVGGWVGERAGGRAGGWVGRRVGGWVVGGWAGGKRVGGVEWVGMWASEQVSQWRRMPAEQDRSC